MTLAEVFSHIKRIKGVESYIVLNDKGKILSFNEELRAPKKLSRLVYFCGRKSSILGKNHFKYMSFIRKNRKNVLIFPFENYYLGVIKKAGSTSSETAEAVLDFLNILVGKSE